MRKILLVDGSHLARRNYHGQSLVTSSGLKTGLMYGSIASLISVQSALKADLVVFAWDTAGSSSWRKAIYPLYKANRTTPEEDYITGLGYLKELLSAMGVMQVESEYAEADDLIGQMATTTFSEDDVYILSGDQDFYQLITDRITVISPKLGEVRPAVDDTIPVIKDKKVIHLRPDQIISYKCLVGDTADNIPGAVGFGIAAAAKFFAVNDNIDQVINGTARLTSLPAKALSAILITKPMFPIFKKVATIKLDAVDNLELSKVNIDKIKAQMLFDLFEFNQFKIRGDQMFKLGGEQC